MENNTKKKIMKSGYEKPQLNIIELAAEEVLAVGCKMQPSATINVNNPSCGIGAGCITRGS
jgi:hypothetical protein